MLEIGLGKITLGRDAVLEIVSSVFVSPGVRNLYVGANGSGKTSLFRYIAGQLRPLLDQSSAPCIRVNGKLLQPLTMSVCAFVPQSPNDGLFGLPVCDELETASDSVDNNFLQSLIGLFELSPLLSRFSYELSDGERMRTSIAIALAARRNWLVLDEWATHLDLVWQNKISQYLTQQVKNDGCGTLEFVNSDQPEIQTMRLDLQLHNKNSISKLAERPGPEDMGVAFGRSRSCLNAFEVKHSGWLRRGTFRKRVQPKVFKSGNLIAVVGRNGSGKTTYLRQLSNVRWSIRGNPNVSLVLAEPGLQIMVDDIEKVLSQAQCGAESRRYVLNQIIYTQPSISTGLLNFSRRKLLGAFLALNSKAPLIAIDEFAVGLDETSLDTMRAMIVYCVQSLRKCVIVSAFDTQHLGLLPVDQIIDLDVEGVC